MNRELNNQKFQETFNKHKSLLNETLKLNNEIGASYGEPVSGMNEGTPPGFPKDMFDEMDPNLFCPDLKK